MPNFTELLFASLLLILTVTRSGWSATLPSIWSSWSSSSSLSLPTSSQKPQGPEPTSPQLFHSLAYEHNSIESVPRICHSNSDCPRSSCCTVGMMRYSQPTCFSLGELGSPCIPGNTVQNFTLSYPSQHEEGREEEVTVIDSFRLLCPCGPELQCDGNTVSCMAA